MMEKWPLLSIEMFTDLNHSLKEVFPNACFPLFFLFPFSFFKINEKNVKPFLEREVQSVLL